MRVAQSRELRPSAIRRWGACAKGICDRIEVSPIASRLRSAQDDFA